MTDKRDDGVVWLDNPKLVYLSIQDQYLHHSTCINDGTRMC